jgi:hypothetical protein
MPTGIGKPELAVLSGIFRMAVDYEEITQNPCRKVQSPEQSANDASVFRGGRLIVCEALNSNHYEPMEKISFAVPLGSVLWGETQ